ncbi:hypothetical protein [Methylobacterium sp. CM6247]
MNTASDIIFAGWPGRKLRKIDGDIARLERMIDKETMMSSPKQTFIEELTIKLNKRRSDRTKLIDKK